MSRIQRTAAAKAGVSTAKKPLKITGSEVELVLSELEVELEEHNRFIKLQVEKLEKMKLIVGEELSIEGMKELTSKKATITEIFTVSGEGRAAFSSVVALTPSSTWKLEVAETDNGAPPGEKAATIVPVEAVTEARTLTGLKFGGTVAAAAGQVFWLLNVGTNNVLLSERDTKSEAVNRFRISGKEAKKIFTLRPFEAIQFGFIASNWKCIGLGAVKREAAIAEPAAELVPLQKAVNEIRTVLKNANLTE